MSSVNNNKSDRLVHWCHGAPGLVLLLILAARFFRNPVYLDQAKDITRLVIWPRGLLKKGVGLCHGISGNGMVLLRLSQECEGNERITWRRRALQYAKFAMDNFEDLGSIPDRPYSLFEGCSGFVCFLMDCSSQIQGSVNTRFPLYEN